MTMQQEQSAAKLLDDETLDLGHYWKVTKLYSWRILFLAVAVTALVAAVLVKITPLYTANASLIIESEQANVVSIEEVYGLDTKRKEYMQTQYEILRSRYIALRTVEELELHLDPIFMGEFNAPPGLVAKTQKWIKESLGFSDSTPPRKLTEEERLFNLKQRAVGKLMRSVEFALVTNTQVIDIYVTSESPKLAAEIANTIGEVYVESYLQAKVDMTSKATTFLTDSLQGLKDKLNRAEKNLADFYENNQVIDLDGVVGLARDELERLTNELVTAQVTLKQNRAIYEQTVSNRANPEAIARLPEVLNHSTIRDARRQESAALSRVAELGERYGPKHPRMIAARAELKSIQSSIDKQISNLISSINTEYLIAQEKVKELEKDVESAKVSYRRLTNLDNSRKALQREVDTNQQLYNSFFTRLQETSELGGFESANARILDSALPPSVPSEPNIKMLSVAAFVFSIIVGVFLAIVSEALNSGIRSVDDVEKKLGQRMLGIIPWLPHKKKSDLPLRSYFDKSNHQFCEAIRTLRTGVSLLNIAKESKAIMVTSSLPREGKSTVATNLAFSLGQIEKTIIVDADLRRPNIGNLFDVPSYQPGLSNILNATHKLEECLVHDEQSKVDILCAGNLTPDPQELLSGKQFNELISQLKQNYQYVIIDTPPLQAVSDAMLIAGSSDSVIYVVKADSTSEKLINSGLGRFLQVGHRLDGVILNQVDLKKADVAERYAGFYDQYGYTSQNKE